MIGGKQSGHSCQIQWVNANKSVKMLKREFFGENNGDAWQDKVVGGETDEANRW